MQGDAPLAAERPDGGEGLQHADLVVGGHHAHQQGVVAQGLAESVQVHQAIGLHRQHGELKAMAGQIAQGLQHRPVLRGQGEQVAPPLAAGLHQPLDRQVVGLGGSTGEDHLPRRHPQLPGQAAAGQIHRRCRLQPRAMGAAGGIGEQPAPVGRHRRHHRWITGGGGLVVQVGGGHPSFPSQRNHSMLTTQPP